MMDGATIRAMSREAAEVASANDLVPFVVEQEDIDDWKAQLANGTTPKIPFPNLGDYEPDGWAHDGEVEMFVDHSGWGQPGERALTCAQMVDRLRPGVAYAITETGQFQLYVASYRRLS